MVQVENTPKEDRDSTGSDSDLVKPSESKII